MSSAADFRRLAREVLRGRWGIAILTGYIASLIGATLSTEFEGSFSFEQTYDISENEMLVSQITELVVGLLPLIIIIGFISIVVSLVLGGAGRLGYARFNLNLVDRKEVSVMDLFSQFHRIGSGIAMVLLVKLYTFLWSLLFVIPGIVQSYSYALTPYVLSENPEMTAKEAITASKQIMQGNRWRLFCLELSFIGWYLLSFLPSIISVPLLFFEGIFGTGLWMVVVVISAFIGSLFITPYAQAARAAFYREVSYGYMRGYNPEFQNGAE